MSTDTNATNGSAARIPQQTTKTTKTTKSSTEDYTPYRPDASTDKVRTTVERSMGDIVYESITQAGHFMYLARHADRDAANSVRYGHLVDATECIEIASMHLEMLKAAVNYRMALPTVDADPRYWPTDQY
ncbi:hypothetical protein ACQEVB_32740 [Pseudonocardia sp. CA-107938]|uniref:hypothetical protein n=1 Tax=Pseudonocardia sp. CA-107938 TaxID=3240021 RepID=UPI003D8B6A08